jgi:hypothetical protein
MFCPIGTPVVAAGNGRVVDTGDSIGPATGRYVTIDLDDGRRVRYLHLSRRVSNVGDRVSRGQLIAYSGATGYGEEDWSWNVAETGGAHVHMTLWAVQRYVFTTNGTLDPALYFDSAATAAGGDATPLEGDDMYDNDPGLRARLDQIVAWQDSRINDLAGLIGANFQGLTNLVQAQSADEVAAAKAAIAEARDQLAGWTRDDANSIRGALSGLSVAGTDPAKIAAAIAPLIPAGVSAKDVADEIAKRLAS